jgi:hypothetical protein
MGVWCGARTADTMRKKTGMRPQLKSGMEFAKRHATERSYQKLCSSTVSPGDLELSFMYVQWSQ